MQKTAHTARTHSSWRGHLLLLATLIAALISVGCDPLSFIAGFETGFIVGRASTSAVEIKTVERVCWQNGVQVPCP